MGGGESTFPLDKINALRLGGRLIAEVSAPAGRRGFVDITPVLDDRDQSAQQEGWHRPDGHRCFRLEHWEYDEHQLDGWDYDIGAVRLRVGTAVDEASLLDLIAAWGLSPENFDYPWDTADPR